jgi:hypothetical protein
MDDTDNKRGKKRIRTDPARSPFNLLRNKFQDKKNSRGSEKNNMDINQFSPIVQMMLEEGKKDDLYYQLLKMMYIDDVDAEHVTNYLGITADELRTAVEELVFLGFLKQTTDDEVELTEDAIIYVTQQDLQ